MNDVITCDVCYDNAPMDSFAKLTDKHGHTWRVCATCIRELWRVRRPPVVPDPSDETPEVATELGSFAGKVADEIIRKLRSET